MRRSTFARLFAEAFPPSLITCTAEEAAEIDYEYDKFLESVGVLLEGIGQWMVDVSAEAAP